MAITIKHAKTDTIADWTQADLDAQIALGNFPPATVLADIVLPSDWNNDHTISGTVPIANGGTGQTTANAAINALLPSQASQSGKVLSTDGTNTSWIAAGGTGTVTSVALTAPSIFSVSGSPITAAGTLALTYSGTALPVANGGSGATTLTGYVKGNGTSAFTASATVPSTDIIGLGTMSTQNANSVTITGGTVNGTTIGATTATTGAFTTLTASTSLTTPTVQATNSGGLSLKNSAGTTQMSMGAGGGDNISLNVSTNLNGSNAQIDISPTGTGHVHINPTGLGSIQVNPTSVGTIDNMTIGATTPKNGSFVDFSVTGTTSFDGSQGTVGQVLTSAGTGATPTWTTPAAGTVTSVTGTAPVVSSGGTTPAISMPAATTSVDGYLTRTDWNTFNGKGSGTVTSVSVTSANGFAGTSSGGATPALTLTTSITGVLKGNGTAISAATSGTDYSAGTSALATGILKSTTTTGALSIAVAADFPTLNQNTTGTAANVTGTVASANGGTGFTTYATGDIIYASATNTLSKLTAGTNGYVLTLASGVPTWAASTGGGVTSFSAGTTGFTPSTATTGVVTLAGTLNVANGGTGLTTLTANYIPYGNGTSAFGNSSSFTYNSTTGDQTAPQQVASNGIIVNAKSIASSYTITASNNAMSVGPVTVATGQSVTVSSGSRWVVL